MKNKFKFFEANKINGLHQIVGGAAVTFTDRKDGCHGDTFYYPDENKKTREDTYEGKKGDMVVAVVRPPEEGDGENLV
jgi:hypothetical protein